MELWDKILEVEAMDGGMDQICTARGGPWKLPLGYVSWQEVYPIH